MPYSITKGLQGVQILISLLLYTNMWQGIGKHSVMNSDKNAMNIYLKIQNYFLKVQYIPPFLITQIKKQYFET